MKAYPFFREAHRIFYPLAALAAFVMPALWVSFYKGKTAYPIAPLKGPEWHALEMLFGFGMLLLAGYLPERLSQKREWKKPVLLWVAVFFWFTERIASLWPHFPRGWFFLISQGLGLSLLVIVFVAVRQSDAKQGTKRRLPLLSFLWLFLILLFVSAKALFLYAALGNDSPLLAIALGLGLYSMQLFLALHLLESLSSFLDTPTTLSSRLSVQFAGRSIKALFFAFLFFAFFGTVGTTFLPARLWLPLLCNLGALLAGLGLLYRLWSLQKARKRSLVSTMLFTSYFTLFYSFFIQALAPFHGSIQAMSLHTFTAGAFGLFGLALMHKHMASLHAADMPVQVVQTGKLLWTIYACLLIGAVLRVAFPAFWPKYYLQSLHHSSGWWTLAYGLFLWRFFPVFFGRDLHR